MEEIIYRFMKREDIDHAVAESPPYGIDRLRKLLGTYLDEQERGLRATAAAEVGSRFAGYVTLLPSAKSGAFKKSNIPQIQDLVVFEKFKRQGIGAELMNRIEAEAGLRSDEVCLGVGLHGINGAAQRLFVKRGYIPDGSGVWIGRSPARPDATIESVGVLTLYMSKKLR